MLEVIGKLVLPPFTSPWVAERLDGCSLNCLSRRNVLRTLPRLSCLDNICSRCADMAPSGLREPGWDRKEWIEVECVRELAKCVRDIYRDAELRCDSGDHPGR